MVSNYDTFATQTVDQQLDAAGHADRIHVNPEQCWPSQWLAH